MGLNSAWGIAIEIIFILCGIIRLAFFNVQEELKHADPNPPDKQKYFRGLPITSITIIFPVVFLFHPLVPHDVFNVILALMFLIVAFLYVLDFKIKKPGNGVITVLMIFVAIVMLRVLNII
jgi:CDP-diacylglycerol--serine O-phosphatidyltransferase